VLATVEHLNAHVIYLRVEGLQSPVGVTDFHRIWSISRKTWTPASSLFVGEKLRTLLGTTHLLSKEWDPKTNLVFNLQVEGAHNFFVLESAVLVHNMDCLFSDQMTPDEAARYREYWEQPLGGTNNTRQRLQVSPGTESVTDFKLIFEPPLWYEGKDICNEF